MASADKTAPIDLATGRRLLIGRPDEDETPGDGVPISVPRSKRRHREDSRSMSRSMVERVDELARDRFGLGLEGTTKDLISEQIEVQLDQVFARIASRDPGKTTTNAPVARIQSSSLAWWIASILAVALFLGAMGVTWDKIRTVEARQIVIQQADAEYAMIVANWLVIQSHTNYERAENLDSMLRIMAAQIGADVSTIPPPVETHPPTAVQRRNNDFIYRDEP